MSATVDFLADLFSSNPYAKSAVRLRRWDDLAKKPERKTKDFEQYRDLLERLVVR